MATTTHIEQLETMADELGLNGVLVRLAEFCDYRAAELEQAGAEAGVLTSWSRAAEIIVEAADRLLIEENQS